MALISKIRSAASAVTQSVPPRSDPRWPFAAILIAYAILGFTVFGFNRTPWQMLLIVGSGAALDVLLSLAFFKRARFPLSSVITCTSLALLLNYSHDSWVLLLPVLLAIGSKYLFTFEGRHVFNPSLFGVATSLLLTSELITTAPAYQWAGGDITLSAVMIMLALMTFSLKIQRGWLIASFLIFYTAQTALRAYILRHHIPVEMMFLGTVSAPAFFLFTFYMITDPATSPKTRRGQVIFALVLTLVDLYLHLYESVFTFFYAAFIIGAGKFLWLHARRLYTHARARRMRSPLGAPPAAASERLTLLRNAAPRLGLAGATLGFIFTANASPTTLNEEDVGLRLKPVASEDSGLGLKMGRVFEETDPRVQHVAKWLLSVGSSVSVGDVDSDGRMDLFMTQLLAEGPGRAQILLNRGDFRFERLETPALEPFITNYRRIGMAAGGTLIDYDGDGDTDLLVAVTFGRARLLENQLSQSGEVSFEDMTERANLGEHHTSIHAGFFDFDQDAALDVVVANILPTHFAHGAKAPLNLFSLAPPEYQGDRRALAFMHDGWHDANNGGENELYRGVGDGKFERFDALPTETRWSLAVCYADLNQDGYTDLYVANDFGPDRVYLNHAGRKFSTHTESRYGQLGKDTYKGMNCSAGDVDNDGLTDVYVSNVHHKLQAEGSLLWMNEGADGFTPQMKDEATQRGALNPHRFGWGAALGDLDNDGWLDLVQANGMVDDRLDPHGYERKDYWYVNHKLMQAGPEIHTYADMWGDIRGRVVYPNERRRVYLNLGARAPGHFEDAAELVGLTQRDNSRGVAFADFDDDGDLDVLITNQHGSPSLFENELRDEVTGQHHFVGLTLEGNGTTTHRSALGTRVSFEIPSEEGEPRKLWRELSATSGLSAQSDPRVHVGLGSHAGAVDVTIHWYGGEIQRLSLEADKYHLVRQADAVGDHLGLVAPTTLGEQLPSRQHPRPSPRGNSRD